MGCSRAEVGYIKMGLNKAFEHMLLGTVLARFKETSVSAKPIWNFPAPPLALHIHYRAELVSAQALLVFLATLFNTHILLLLIILAAIPVNPELLIFKTIKLL